MPVEIRINQTLTDEFLEDIMVTMVESGDGCIWYWGRIKDVVRREDLNVTSFEVTDDDDMISEWKTIDHGVVADAIQDLLDGTVKCGYPLEYIRRGVMELDAGDIDSTAADCIVQAALFGELVYG
jgi:hypothetical protein